MAKDKPITWKTESVPIGSLEGWDKNPAKISKEDALDLRDGIRKFGFIIPFVAAGPMAGNKIPLVDGHQRKTVSIQLLELPPETLVDIRIPSRKLTEKERAEIAVRLRKNTGDFDEEKLREFFEKEDLLEWGFREEELEEMDFEDFDLAEEEEQEETSPDPSGLIGIMRPRWASRHSRRFLALRSFTTERKKREIAWLKQIKRDRPDRESKQIARELSQALYETFGDLPGFIVTSAPSHSTGFSHYLGELVAKDLELEYIDLFQTKEEKEAPRRIFGSDRPEIRSKKTKKGIVWVDDTLTTGQTLKACREQVSGPFIPIVWIYDDAQGGPGDG